MPTYQYRIGSTFGGLINTETLTISAACPRGVVPVGTPVQDWATRYIGSNGLPRQDGLPICQWRFTAIPYAAYNLLRAYWSGLPGARLYITTRKADGTFADFTANGIWPETPTPDTGTFRDLIISWTHMVELEVPVLSKSGSDEAFGDYTLLWTSVEFATSYILEEATDAEFSDATVVFSGASTSHNVTGKENDTFYYRVRACDGAVCGSYSNTVTATALTLCYGWPLFQTGTIGDKNVLFGGGASTTLTAAFFPGPNDYRIRFVFDRLRLVTLTNPVGATGTLLYRGWRDICTTSTVLALTWNSTTIPPQLCTGTVWISGSSTVFSITMQVDQQCSLG